jgi:hypothetical protein
MRGHLVTLEVAGEVEIRRLSPGDADQILDILSSVIQGAANRQLLTGVPFDLSNPASVFATFLSGLHVARKQAREFVISLLAEDVRPQVTFGDLGTLLTAMTTHPDVVGFFANARPALESPLAAHLREQFKTTTPEETAPES